MNLKDGIRPDTAAQRQGRERRIASRMEGIEGIVATPDEAQAGLTLAHALQAGPMDVGELLALGTGLARTLAEMHRRGVLHQDIHPGCIVLRGPHQAPLLNGFSHATTFAEERPGFTHHREIRGHLPYMAPELTGRTGRSVDLRADLYALGATLYEAAAGRPPFDARDPLQLLHDHMARLPAPPSQLRADLPEALSRVILRLLEKEPQRRYQSADGLAHDLARVQQALASGESAPIVLGENDFAMQLAAPASLVGRGAEIATLRQALEEAVQGRGRIVLVSGAPGVGKTSLINELRPMVTERRGWFVSGKFDQYRQDPSAAVTQAFRALGRLLLAEPQAELSAQRDAILAALGANAGLMCTLPEFALLLGPQAEVLPAEPAQAEARLVATGLDLLRTMASARRPLVMVLDDLQWAGAMAVRFVQALADAPNLPGLLLVGSYRDMEVEAGRPLAALVSNLESLDRKSTRLHLENLRGEDVAELLQEMMRLPQAQAAALAEAVKPHTAGNPYDTIELLNTLRRDGTLQRTSAGWRWDAAALRRHVGRSGVLDLLAVRVARLPAQGRPLMEAIACLGGEVPARLLAEATGVPAIELEECLTAAVEDGLLAIQQGDRVVLRMRHDRVQQAVYGALAPAQRRERHLSLARRLAASGSFRVAAAQQYLPAAEDIREPRECRRVARLMHDIAARMQAAADFAAAEVLLAAALSLLARLRRPTRDDESLRAAMEVQRHVTLCSLGRFEDADALYRTIEARGAAVEDWVDAVCAQVDSLQNRSRPADAIKLGLGVLSRLGVDVPVDFAGAEVDARVKTLNQWAEDVVPGDDPRPYTGDRRVTAQSRLLHRLTYPAYFYNIRIEAWLIAQAQDLWARFGPSPDLVHALAAMGAAVIILSGNYRSGYRGARHALAISESRGWEPGTSTARLQFAVHVSNWFDPLEETLRQLHLARAGAQRNGEVQSTCFSYRPSSTALMDCSPTIQGWAEETEAGLVFASRIRNEYVVAMMTIERQLIAALRAEPQAEVALPEGASACVERQAKLPAVSLSLHFARAFLAAVFDDDASFPGHAARAMEHVGVVASYRVATVRLLNDLALARRVRSASGAERAKLLEQLDAGCEWMAARAADGPANFAHLSEWLKAERAWAAGDVARSAAAFDVALGRAESAVRCWHRAMIAERAGLFHLEQGMGRSGRQFIREARDAWRAWGAPAKVRHMERAHEFLRADIVAARAGGDESPMGVDTLDMLAIVRASQALSSETSLVRLKRRIADVTAALTGATGVQFALWDSDANDWTVSDGETPQAIGAEEAGRRGLLPLAALRYAERTREPLVVADAADDDRFSRDPYFAGLGHASLLAVPVLSQGSVRAMLLLENRLSRGAFSTAHLDAVSLIAGQLAVSLDNALLYDRLEQRVREQTRELVDAARRAGMAQIATNVLHNVGNVLNSVNTSSRLIRLQVLESRGARVTDLADLLERHANDLDKFFASGGKGRVMPVYVRELAVALAAEREEMLGELRRLDASIEHINNVVAMQQSYAGTSGMLERASISTLVDDALGLQEDAFARQGVAVARDYAPAEPLSLDKTRVMQILVNLLENARQAMEQTPAPHKLRISVRQDEAGATVRVSDNGCGITRDNLARMFSHGFTTKPGGHGFGLHSCAVAAREMGGSLTVQSEGEGAGATFTLCLPPGGVRESSAS